MPQMHKNHATLLLHMDQRCTCSGFDWGKHAVKKTTALQGVQNETKDKIGVARLLPTDPCRDCVGLCLCHTPGGKAVKVRSPALQESGLKGANVATLPQAQSTAVMFTCAFLYPAYNGVFLSLSEWER